MDSISLGFSVESGKELLYRQEAHLCMFGPTGSFKTSGFLLPSLLAMNRSSKFMIDTKGMELTQVAGEYLASLGPYYAIAPYGLGGPTPKGVRVCRYNPMAPLFDGSMPEIFHMSVARRNSDGCIGGDSVGRDAFWVNGARVVFTDVQLALGKYGKPSEKNLPTAARIIKSRFRKFCIEIASKGDRILSPVFQSYLAEHKKEKGGFSDIINNIIVETAFLLDPAVEQCLSGSDFRFEELGRRIATIALCTPLNMLSINGKLSRLLVECCLFELLTPERPRKREIVMFCDEARQYGTMDALANAYATARAFRVRIFTSWTDIGQIERLYPDDYLSILANSGAQIFLGSRDPKTSRFISEQSGFRDAVSYSRNVNWGRDGWPSVSDSKSIVRREVVMMQEAQNLPADQALLWVRGIPGVIRARHRPYFKQWRYFFRYRKNPLLAR